MANYHREINKMMEKLIYRFLILDKKGCTLESKGENLSFLEIHIIKEIGRSFEKSIYNLVRETDMDRSTITTIINRLVLNDYLSKEKSEEDKRIYILRLTDRGQEVYNKIENTQKDIVESILNDITLNEEKAILKFLSKVNQKIL